MDKLNDQALIDIEVERIKSYPQFGYFTFLHPKGPVIEQSNNVMERVEDILKNKRPSEILTCLRHIYRLPATFQEVIATALKVHQETIETEWKVHQETMAPAWKAALDLIPDCRWDGKTILA